MPTLMPVYPTKSALYITVSVLKCCQHLRRKDKRLQSARRQLQRVIKHEQMLVRSGNCKTALGPKQARTFAGQQRTRSGRFPGQIQCSCRPTPRWYKTPKQKRVTFEPFRQDVPHDSPMRDEASSCVLAVASAVPGKATPSNRIREIKSSEGDSLGFEAHGHWNVRQSKPLSSTGRPKFWFSPIDLE